MLRLDGFWTRSFWTSRPRDARAAASRQRDSFSDLALYNTRTPRLGESSL